MSGKRVSRASAKKPTAKTTPKTTPKATSKAKATAKKNTKGTTKASTVIKSNDNSDISDDDFSDQSEDRSEDRSDVEHLDDEYVDADDVDGDDDADDDVDGDGDDDADDVDDVDADDDADDVDADDVDADDDVDVDGDDADDSTASQKRGNEFDFIYSGNANKTTTSREIVVVKNENRVTSHMLSKTEITEAVSIRCAQIQKNPVVFVDIEGITDPIIMAKKEINERKCPLVLRRFIGRYNSRDYYEYWDINEMSRPFIYEL